MNRLAGGVAGTALAGGEDKWYEDSAGLLSYNVLKTGKSGQREETTHLYRAEVDQCLPPEVITGHAATTCMMSCRVLSPTSAPSTSTWSIQPARCRDEPGTGLVPRSRPHQPAGVLGRAAVAPGCHQAHRERRVGVYWIIGIVAGLALSTVFPPAHRRVVSAAGAATMNAPNHVVERDATGCRPAHPCPPAPWRAPHPAP